MLKESDLRGLWLVCPKITCLLGRETQSGSPCFMGLNQDQIGRVFRDSVFRFRIRLGPLRPSDAGASCRPPFGRLETLDRLVRVRRVRHGLHGRTVRTTGPPAFGLAIATRIQSRRQQAGLAKAARPGIADPPPTVGAPALPHPSRLPSSAAIVIRFHHDRLQRSVPRTTRA